MCYSGGSLGSATKTNLLERYLNSKPVSQVD